MHDCAELLDISLAQLRDALKGRAADAAGATTWLSAALTNQGTCDDSLAAATPAPAGRDAVRKQVVSLARFIRTALALHVKKVKGVSRRPPQHRHLIKAPCSRPGLLVARARQEAPRVSGDHRRHARFTVLLPLLAPFISSSRLLAALISRKHCQQADQLINGAYRLIQTDFISC